MAPWKAETWVMTLHDFSPDGVVSESPMRYVSSSVMAGLLHSVPLPKTCAGLQACFSAANLVVQVVPSATVCGLVSLSLSLTRATFFVTTTAEPEVSALRNGWWGNSASDLIGLAEANVASTPGLMLHPAVPHVTPLGAS